VLVRQVISRIQSFGAEKVEELQGVEENVVFSLPKGLNGNPGQ